MKTHSPRKLAQTAEKLQIACLEKDGVLQAVRLMDEHNCQRVLVRNDLNRTVGAFHLGESRITWEPSAPAE